MNEKLIGTITVEMNKYICSFDEDSDYEWIGYRESDKSAIKRIADTFGFDAKRIKLAEENSNYEDGLYVGGEIEVCGFKYDVDLKKNKIFQW